MCVYNSSTGEVKVGMGESWAFLACSRQTRDGGGVGKKWLVSKEQNPRLSFAFIHLHIHVCPHTYTHKNLEKLL